MTLGASGGIGRRESIGGTYLDDHEIRGDVQAYDGRRTS